MDPDMESRIEELEEEEEEEEDLSKCNVDWT